MKKQRAEFTHNWVAKELCSGKFRSSVVKSKKEYSRKGNAAKAKFYD